MSQLSGVERRKTEVTNGSILKIENSSMLKNVSVISKF